MTIKKSRLAALITVMLVFSIMVTMLVVPASAATYDVSFTRYLVPGTAFIAAYLEQYNAPLMEETYIEMAENIALTNETLLVDKSGNVYFGQSISSLLKDTYGVAFNDPPHVLYYYEVSKTYEELYKVNYTISDDAINRGTVTYTYSTPTLAESVSSDSLKGVLDHIIDLLPIVLVVIIGFIGLRKGISFIRSVLHRA